MSTRVNTLKSKMKSIEPSETQNSLYPVKEFFTNNKLFLVGSAGISKGGIDDDIAVLEERDNSNIVVRRYLYWSLQDLDCSTDKGYELI